MSPSRPQPETSQSDDGWPSYSGYSVGLRCTKIYQRIAFCNSTPTPNSPIIPPSNMGRASTPKGVERGELQWGVESQKAEGELRGGIESHNTFPPTHSRVPTHSRTLTLIPPRTLVSPRTLVPLLSYPDDIPPPPIHSFIQ